jgi:transcriptional regulator with XRE-family HTH domain
MQALQDRTPLRRESDVSTAKRALAAVPDRAAREAAAALARQAFCARLKETRERKGIGLDVIADITKVSEALYAGLERNDLSRWPVGIYRRSFFRSYATAIGLPVDSAVLEFLQLFPDDSEPRLMVPAPSGASSLRMTVAGNAWLRITRVQLLATAIDIMMVGGIAGAVVWWMPTTLGTAVAVVSVVYYSFATACFACSPGLWWLRTRSRRKRAKALRLAR